MVWLRKVAELADRLAQVAYVTMAIWPATVCRCSLGQGNLQQRWPDPLEAQRCQVMGAALLMLPMPQQAPCVAMTSCMSCRR